LKNRHSSHLRLAEAHSSSSTIWPITNRLRPEINKYLADHHVALADTRRQDKCHHYVIATPQMSKKRLRVYAFMTNFRQLTGLLSKRAALITYL
jgi:hypothetical protein